MDWIDVRLLPFSKLVEFMCDDEWNLIRGMAPLFVKALHGDSFVSMNVQETSHHFSTVVTGKVEHFFIVNMHKATDYIIKCVISFVKKPTRMA